MTIPGAPVFHPVEDPFKAYPPLTLRDRCDQRACDAAAAARLVCAAVKGDVSFCAHHYHNHALALERQGFMLVATSGVLSGARL